MHKSSLDYKIITICFKSMYFNNLIFFEFLFDWSVLSNVLTGAKLYTRFPLSCRFLSPCWFLSFRHKLPLSLDC